MGMRENLPRTSLRRSRCKRATPLVPSARYQARHHTQRGGRQMNIPVAAFKPFRTILATVVFALLLCSDMRRLTACRAREAYTSDPLSLTLPLRHGRGLIHGFPVEQNGLYDEVRDNLERPAWPGLTRLYILRIAADLRVKPGTSPGTDDWNGDCPERVVIRV